MNLALAALGIAGFCGALYKHSTNIYIEVIYNYAQGIAWRKRIKFLGYLSCTIVA